MIAILGKDGPPDEALARKMLAAAPHRGQSIMVRRLGNSILGVANRPDFIGSALSSEGPLIAALSGRIDNAPELRKMLAAAGTPPTSESDADIAVAAFRAFDVDAPRRMRGAFAGIVTDGRNVWCFRDHIGFGPLFYRDDARAFFAASEARQVAVGADLNEEPDLQVLEQMFFGRMESNTPSALKGVARQPQATTLAASADKGVVLRRYWNPLELLETIKLSADDFRDRFLELLSQAAARSLTGKDVILLSGGLDSPAVAAFAAPEHRRRTGQPLGALSAVFPDLPAVDESRYIQIVAQRFGIDLHTFRPTNRPLDNVDHWVRVLGTPIPVLSVEEISAAYSRARNLGYDNILTGEFAEFVFGSPRHLAQHLLTHGRWGALSNLLRAEHRRGSGGPLQLAVLLVQAFVPGRAAIWYIRRRGLDLPHRIPKWLDQRKIEVPLRDDLLPPSRERWRQLQLSGTEGATITLEADDVCATMAGVTVRRPMADIDLWEFFLGLPAEIKHPDLRFKILVHSKLRGILPDEILDRRDKTVFDDHIMTHLDYDTLTRLLVKPRQRMPGVNYELLAERIERRELNRYDWFWARDLAWIHAFLNRW